MAPATSFFLDLLRTVAALTVVGVHCVYFWYRSFLPAVDRLAHCSVIVFFVLSGYVIAYSTLRKTREARAYVIARLSRLYSVLVPALVLTAVLQVAGHALDPGDVLLQPHGHDLFRYLSSSLYLQSVWTFASSPQANGPLWSLSYEFWYYVLFGAAVLLRPGVARTLGVLAVALVAGLNILLLLPCWLAGVAAYSWQSRAVVGGPWPGRGIATVWPARIAFGVSLLVIGAELVCVPPWPRVPGQPPLWFSSMFLSDWLMALAVAAMIVCFEASRFPPPPPRLWTGVRWGAGHTFSLYLFHFPILAFITAAWHLREPPLWRAALALAGTLLAVLLLSTFTEAKRTVWQRWFARGWDALAPALQH